MKTTLLFPLALLAAGCSSNSTPDDPPAQPETLAQAPATADIDPIEQLLIENDLMQARILVSSGYPDGLPLAQALLDRLEQRGIDTRGEIALYRALAHIREQQNAEAVQQLQLAADQGHPHAVALLYKVYHDPYLVERADQARAQQYKDAYARLDVARSGYPSFSQALEVVDQLLQHSSRIGTPTRS